LSGESNAEKFVSAFAVGILIVVLLFPVLTLVLLSINFYRLDKPELRHRFGSLYEDLDFSNRFSLLYHYIFAVRRIGYAIVAIFLTEWPFIQIWWFLIQSALVIIYQIKVMPFNHFLMNYLEIFNELCIAACGYHLVCLTDYADGPQLKYDAGWSMILIVLINIIFNLIVITFVSIGLLRVAFRRLKEKYL